MYGNPKVYHNLFVLEGKKKAFQPCSAKKPWRGDNNENKHMETQDFPQPFETWRIVIDAPD